jgi:hypothetical protein
MLPIKTRVALVDVTGFQSHTRASKRAQTIPFTTRCDFKHSRRNPLLMKLSHAYGYPPPPLCSVLTPLLHSYPTKLVLGFCAEIGLAWRVGIAPLAVATPDTGALLRGLEGSAREADVRGAVMRARNAWKVDKGPCESILFSSCCEGDES